MSNYFDLIQKGLILLLYESFNNASKNKARNKISLDHKIMQRSYV